ncbi:MAG: MarR family transcriptional regulator [Rhodobacteraceae bacterium]|jgi:deoxyribonucleoside regulator|nr:MarR family transcriptional regulator [Paracoccaceae bacterium]MBL4559179.1 MarR family transcriptional regulator [Paracoccaceae bacterium]
MAKDTAAQRVDKHAMLANVALLYYGEGLTQGDIARRMRVSRATIVGMLREAREAGIVDIRVDGRSLAGSTLSHDLRQAWGLDDVYVAECGEATARPGMLRQLGRVAAIALTELVRPQDRVGVAWGETVRAMSEQMPRTETTGVRVYQMIGSMMSDSVPTSESCAIQIANMLGAECSTLHAPALGSTAEVAALFRAEPTIRAQLGALQALDLTVASIGHVGDETHLARARMASGPEMRAARAAGAAGILCCRFVDAAGRALALPPDARLLAAELDSIRRARTRLLVVGGTDRLAATIAAIRGGYVSHLCVDGTLARALLGAAR